MDSFVKTACPLLESHRTDVTKIAVAAFSIVKALDVIEHIGPRLVSSAVAHAVDALGFQKPKEITRGSDIAVYWLGYGGRL